MIPVIPILPRRKAGAFAFFLGSIDKKALAFYNE